MHVITLLLQLQANIKLYHWMTTSYPRHVASDTLYEELDSHIDNFVEVFIGKYKRPKLSNTDMKIHLTSLDDSSVLNYLENILVFLTKNINKFINDTDVDLLSIRDDIVSSLNKSKYLFSLQ